MFVDKFGRHISTRKRSHCDSDDDDDDYDCNLKRLKHIGDPLEDGDAINKRYLDVQLDRLMQELNNNIKATDARTTQTVNEKFEAINSEITKIKKTIF
jgi:hypothetical protein